MCIGLRSNIPVKRYWWIFFRSAFGINLQESATRRGLEAHAIEELTFCLKDKEWRYGWMGVSEGCYLQDGEFEAAGVAMGRFLVVGAGKRRAAD
jgi:hypothetical protein